MKAATVTATRSIRRSKRTRTVADPSVAPSDTPNTSQQQQQQQQTANANIEKQAQDVSPAQTASNDAPMSVEAEERQAVEQGGQVTAEEEEKQCGNVSSLAGEAKVELTTMADTGAKAEAKANSGDDDSSRQGTKRKRAKKAKKVKRSSVAGEAGEVSNDAAMSVEAEERKAEEGQSEEVVAEGGQQSTSGVGGAEAAEATTTAEIEAAAEETAEAKSEEDDDTSKAGRKRKRDKKAKAKLKRSESLADVSNFPVDVKGVSFMLMGDVDRSLCEGLIYSHGALISKQVLKKQQYVIAGPPKRTHWRGGMTGENTRIWKSAKEAGKTFISQSDFERWMERVQAAKDAAEAEEHAADEHLVQLLLEATSLPEVLIDLVAQYALDEAPIVPIVRQWLKLEQRASDGTHWATLPSPATDEQIADVERRLKTRLPFALRTLLRMHNGASLQGDSAGMRVFPSTEDLLAFRPDHELFTVPLRWLMWQHDLDTSRTPHYIKSVYFVPPNGPLVAVTTHERMWDTPHWVFAESMEQFMQQYVEAWKSNVDADAEEEEGKKDGVEEKEERKEEKVQDSSMEGASATSTAASSTVQLSPSARHVAACRPSALSVPCIQEMAAVREAHPRVWRQAQTTNQRGGMRLRQWSTVLHSPATAPNNAAATVVPMPMWQAIVGQLPIAPFAAAYAAHNVVNGQEDAGVVPADVSV